jgi:DNA end-binding protein Ku
MREQRVYTHQTCNTETIVTDPAGYGVRIAPTDLEAPAGRRLETKEREMAEKFIRALE